MNLEKVLCEMLYHTCASNVLEDGIKEFRFDLHCKEILIQARYVKLPIEQEWEGIDYKYEIIKYEFI